MLFKLIANGPSGELLKGQYLGLGVHNVRSLYNGIVDTIYTTLFSGDIVLFLEETEISYDKDQFYKCLYRNRIVWIYDKFLKKI